MKSFPDSEKQKARQRRAFRIWLGYQDSNLGMLESESSALPLGDTPKDTYCKKDGGYDGIRTCDPNIMSVVL